MNGAAGLKHLFATEIVFQDAAKQRDHLLVQLPAERAALDAELKALSSAIETAQTRRQNLSIADRRCTAIFSQYRTCLAKRDEGSNAR